MAFVDLSVELRIYVGFSRSGRLGFLVHRRAIRIAAVSKFPAVSAGPAPGADAAKYPLRCLWPWRRIGEHILPVRLDAARKAVREWGERPMLGRFRPDILDHDGMTWIGVSYDHVELH